MTPSSSMPDSYLCFPLPFEATVLLTMPAGVPGPFGGSFTSAATAFGAPFNMFGGAPARAADPTLTKEETPAASCFPPFNPILIFEERM